MDQIYKRLDRIEDKLDENTKTTTEGFERVNGRIKKLETKEAFREGFEKGAGMSSDTSWRKLSFKLVGIIVAILGIATTLAVIAERLLT